MRIYVDDFPISLIFEHETCFVVGDYLERGTAVAGRCLSVEVVERQVRGARQQALLPCKIRLKALRA